MKILTDAQVKLNRKELERLIMYAAQMARCANMPSTFKEDYPATIPKHILRRIINDAEKAEAQCKEWAYQIALIEKELRK